MAASSGIETYSYPTPDGNWTTSGIDVTTCYGVHFDPFDARRMFISYTDIGLWASDTAGASWYSATRSGVPRQWVNTTYWMEFDPDGARPHVGGDERHARSAAAQDVAPRFARFLHAAAWCAPTMAAAPGACRITACRRPPPPTFCAIPAGALYVTGFGRGVFKSDRRRRDTGR